MAGARSVQLAFERKTVPFPREELERIGAPSGPSFHPAPARLAVAG
jgi:hypothetical protein